MRNSRNRSTGFRLISSVACLLSLVGCGSGFTPLERTLPPAPSFAQPVAYRPGVRATAKSEGESCYVALPRNEGTTRQANSTIVRFRSWYDGVRKNYSPKGKT